MWIFIKLKQIFLNQDENYRLIIIVELLKLNISKINETKPKIVSNL